MAMLIDRVLCSIEGEGIEAAADAAVVEEVRAEIVALVERLPLYPARQMPA